MVTLTLRACNQLSANDGLRQVKAGTVDCTESSVVLFRLHISVTAMTSGI